MSAGAGIGEREGGALLRTEGVGVRFGGLVALEDVSIDVEPSRITALIGPNGAGKSTLLHAISGFLKPTSGRVRLRGADITDLPAHARIGLGMARTFQDNEVLPRLTVLENTLLGIQDPMGERVWRLVLTPGQVRRQRQAGVARALAILDSVGLMDLADRMAGALSYGQQKMLVLARLLATDADLFMLDEPGAGLSSRYIDQVGEALRRMVELGKTVVLVDHNMRLIMNYAHRVVVLHHGQVIARGTPDEIKAHPEVLDCYLTHRKASATAADAGGAEAAR